MEYYFRVPNAIFDKDYYLSSSDKIVYLYLCRCSNNKAGFPSYTTIARKAGINRRTAIRSVTTLSELGLIKIDHYQGHPNRYTLPGI